MKMMFGDKPYTYEDVLKAYKTLDNTMSNYDGLVWQFGSVSEITIKREEIDSIRTAVKAMRDYVLEEKDW